jgi:hypothetical protein
MAMWARRFTSQSDIKDWPRRGSNPHSTFVEPDFKSDASACFATRPKWSSVGMLTLVDLDFHAVFIAVDRSKQNVEGGIEVT